MVDDDAAGSQHLAVELVSRYRYERRGNTSIALTAIGINRDHGHGYERINGRHIEAFVARRTRSWP